MCSGDNGYLYNSLEPCRLLLKHIRPSQLSTFTSELHATNPMSIKLRERKLKSNEDQMTLYKANSVDAIVVCRAISKVNKIDRNKGKSESYKVIWEE